MFTVTRQENHLHLKFDGALDPAQMDVALDDFEQKSEGLNNGTMLYEIGDFDLPSLATMGVKLGRVPRLLRLVGNFDKMAIVTDKKWVQKAGELEGALIPGLDIKAFNTEDLAEAEAWLGRA